MRYIKSKLEPQKGFTLIELMAVLGILALIVLIAVPAVGGIMDDAEQKAEASSIEMIEKAGGLAYLSDIPFDDSEEESYTVKTLVDEGYLDLSEEDTLYGETKRVVKATNDTFEYVKPFVYEYADGEDFNSAGMVLNQEEAEAMGFEFSYGELRYTDWQLVKFPSVIEGNYTSYHGIMHRERYDDTEDRLDFLRLEIKWNTSLRNNLKFVAVYHDNETGGESSGSMLSGGDTLNLGDIKPGIDYLNQFGANIEYEE